MRSQVELRAYLRVQRCADMAETGRDTAYLRRRPFAQAIGEAARRAAGLARLERELARTD